MNTLIRLILEAATCIITMKIARFFLKPVGPSDATLEGFETYFLTVILIIIVEKNHYYHSIFLIQFTF